MANSLILEGKDYDKLISFGVKKLGVSLEEIEVNVLKKPGFMGLGNKNFVVKLTVKETKKKSPEKSKAMIDESFDDGDKTLTSADKESGNDAFDAEDFYFDYRSDGVYLKLSHPQKYKADLNPVLRFLERKQIQDYSLTGIKENVQRGNEDFFKIAENQSEVTVDSSIRIEIAPDFMKAYGILLPAIGGVETKRERIIAEAKKQIKFGLKEQILGRMVDEKNYNNRVLIAEGVEAQDGIDGRVEYLLDTKPDVHPTVLENGAVDLKSINIISNVEEGQTIAKLILSTAGKDGMTVNGNEIRCRQGQRAKYALGKNVDLSEDNKFIIASKKGQFKLSGDKIDIIESYEISGDVDNSTGHVDFNGSVRIKGSVKTGFNVKATEDIEIDGVAEATHIQSGQNIVIKRGMHGNNEGFLEARNDVSAKYLMNCTVSAGGNVFSGEVMHSNIESKGFIKISGKSSVIVGGTTKAKFDIEVGEIGSEVETPTTVEVGADPELKAKYEYARKKMDELVRGIENNEKSIQILKKQHEKGSLSEEKFVTLKQLLSKNKEMSRELQQFKEDFQDLDEKLESLTGGKIKVNGTVYPGVKIIIGNEILFVRKALKHCSIYRVGGEIVVGAY